MALNILYITPSLTTRTYRQAEVLSFRGNNIDIAYYGIGNNVELIDWKKPFKNVFVIPHTNSIIEPYKLLFSQAFKRFIKKLDKPSYDIIIAVSNFDTLAIAAKKYSKLPVVFDVRDMTSLLSPYTHGKNYLPNFTLNNKIVGKTFTKIIFNKILKNEKQALENSDGVIVPSDYIKNVILKEYRYNLKKNLVFYNYIPKKYVIIKKPKKYSEKDGKIHLVYEGFLSLTGYRDILSILMKLLSENTVIHIYGNGTMEAIKKYKTYSKKFDNFRYEGFLPPKELMYEISKCDIGILPFLKSVDPRHIDSGLSNKLFDYLGASLPIISTPCYSFIEFFKKEKVGKIINIYEEDKSIILKAIEEIKEIKIDPNKFVLENKIELLETFLKSFVL